MTKVGRKYVWDDSEVEYLRNNIDEFSFEDIGMAIGVSSTTVRIKAIELGLVKSRSVRACRWSAEQIEFLRDNFPTRPFSDLEAHIGYSYGTILRKANELGLKRAEGYDKNGFRGRYTQKYNKKV